MHPIKNNKAKQSSITDSCDMRPINRGIVFNIQRVMLKFEMAQTNKFRS